MLSKDSDANQQSSTINAWFL